MNYQPTTDDALIANLLRRVDADPDSPQNEAAEDLFELFIEGKLPEQDQDEFFEYLEANPSARQAASEYLLSLDATNAASPVEPLATPAERATSWRSSSMLTFALAACLMLALGIGLLSPDGGD